MAKYYLAIIFGFFLYITNLWATTPDKPIETSYFASLRANKTNVRSGPGNQYPVKFTFKLRGLPIKVVSEYDNWSEIQDYLGDTGWINQNLITKKREVIIKTKQNLVNLYEKSNQESKIILKLENNVVGSLVKCQLSWCNIKIASKNGWVLRDKIWGVDDND